MLNGAHYIAVDDFDAFFYISLNHCSQNHRGGQSWCRMAGSMAAKVHFASHIFTSTVFFNSGFTALLLSRNAVVQVSAMFRHLKKSASS